MSINQHNLYDFDIHIAEIYDMQENNTKDVEFLRNLLHGKTRLKILEPFCGTGRFVIPLAFDGHSILGIDQSQAMLQLAQKKIKDLADDVQKRIQLQCADVTVENWPTGYDLVILGFNCFYELATAEEQEYCIYQASRACKPGGFIYVDNDHMEGELDAAWQDLNHKYVYLSGTCKDGTQVKNTRETIWFDVKGRLARFERRYQITSPEGIVTEYQFFQQKHPVSQVEVQTWLEKHGFEVLAVHGDHSANPYHVHSLKAIFWARKR
ncbi:MAG: class I SAM-dependent methyltransferase [Anaerolineaceae bacterium]|nr:class I SAM-dependent methyltransferase [Anaerolineaceae bacterium]